MSRRGRCRCGTVLGFESGPNGYKCAAPPAVPWFACATDDTPDPVERRQRQKSGVLAFRPPAPSDPESPVEEGPLVSPDDYNYDALRPGELPVVELVPLSELAPAPDASFWRRWWLPLTALFVVATSTVVIILMLRG